MKVACRGLHVDTCPARRRTAVSLIYTADDNFSNTVRNSNKEKNNVAPKDFVIFFTLIEFTVRRIMGESSRTELIGGPGHDCTGLILQGAIESMTDHPPP